MCPVMVSLETSAWLSSWRGVCSWAYQLPTWAHCLCWSVPTMEPGTCPQVPGAATVAPPEIQALGLRASHSSRVVPGLVAAMLPTAWMLYFVTPEAGSGWAEMPMRWAELWVHCRLHMLTYKITHTTLSSGSSLALTGFSSWAHQKLQLILNITEHLLCAPWWGWLGGGCWMRL